MIDTLWRASLSGAVAVVVVWAIGALLGSRLPARTRTWLWWCTAARFVVALVWTSPLELAVLPAPAPVVATQAPATLPLRVSRGVSEAAVSTTPALPAPAGRRAALPLVLFALWLAGLGAVAVTGLRRWREARLLVESSWPVTAEIAALMDVAARRIGLAHAPPVRFSGETDTPLVVGVLHPVVLLPVEQFAELDPAGRMLALAHECEHVRRWDLRLGLVPALAEALFYFHPLARVTAREYALWRESACDEAVIRALDAEPAAYGRLLLGLGVSRPRIGLAAAGASVSAANLKRRLLMLASPAPSRRTMRTVSTGAFLLAASLVLPVRLTARAAAQLPPRPPTPPATAPTPPAVTAARGTAPVPTAPTPPSPVPSQNLPPDAPRPPAPPASANFAPIPPIPVDTPPGFAFVVSRDGKNRILTGDVEDSRRARALMQDNLPLLWFRMDGKEYVVRDTAIIGQVEAAWKPVNAIGDDQGKIGEKQGELGKQQGQIGSRQGDIGKEQGKLAEKQAELAVAQAQANLASIRASSEDERRAAKDQQRGVEQKMRDLNAEMKELSGKMKAEAEPMDELGAKMNELGKEMNALGQKMKVAAEAAEADTRAIARRAIASGAAQLVK